MIARLRGRPAANTPEGLVLDVNGVGYLVHATPAAVRKGDSADEITVETYLHVREDVLQLYGFADRSERELFVQLLAVSGIGPKVALAIVSGSPVADLRRAIARRSSATGEPETIASATFGPTPPTARSRMNSSRSLRSAKP